MSSKMQTYRDIKQAIGERRAAPEAPPAFMVERNHGTDTLTVRVNVRTPSREAFLEGLQRALQDQEVELLQVILAGAKAAAQMEVEADQRSAEARLAELTRADDAGDLAFA